MHVLETQIIQREFDGRWEKVVRVEDYENSCTYINEYGKRTTYVPHKWLTVAVYDFLMETV